MNRVLIIDDDRELCALIRQSILQESIEADCCYSGKSGLLQLKDKEYQLVILDVMMPGFDGFETLEQIRQESSLPILMFTSKNDCASKVRGLRAGADDYLTKPFYLDELKARIQALLKRTGKLEDSNGLSYGNIRLNLLNKSTLVDDQPVDLIGKEFDLVVYLMQNQNVILPKEQIFDRIWGYDSDTTVTVVEVYMSKIRKKLKDTEFVNNLSTLRNVGYILR